MLQILILQLGYGLHFALVVFFDSFVPTQGFGTRLHALGPEVEIRVGQYPVDTIRFAYPALFFPGDGFEVGIYRIEHL